MKIPLRSLIVMLVLVAACSGGEPAADSTVPDQPTSTLGTSEEAIRYIQEALEVMRANSVYTDDVDWERIEEAMLSAAAGAHDVGDTHEAIRVGLRLMDEGHSLYIPALDVLASDPGLADFDPPVVELMAEGLGVVQVGKFIGDIGDQSDSYATELASAIDAMQGETCGWMVDLRVATLGNPWPMLAGLSPLLAVGELGGFTHADGSVEVWANEGSSVTLDGVALVHNLRKVTESSSKPVALLVGSLTGQPGEAVAIAFRGQAGVMIFGQPTRGHTASIRPIEMSDGAVISLTTANFSDRDGNQYGEGVPVEPDVTTPTPTAAEEAAIEWLLAQPGCQ